MPCPGCEKFIRDHPLVPAADQEPLEDLVHVLVRDDGGVPRQTMSAIKCAFPFGKFVSDNWNCRTMSALRGLCEHGLADEPPPTHGNITFFSRHDSCQASIGVVTIPEYGAFDEKDVQDGYLVMTWYKSRGCTPQAVVMWDDEMGPLRLETALWILQDMRV